MDTLQKVILYYRAQVEKFQKELSVEKKKIYRIGSFRLLLFLVGAVGAGYFIAVGRPLTAAAVAVVVIIPFLLLIKVHSKMFRRKDYLEQAITVNQQELRAIDYNPSDFDEGACYIDPSHSFSFDIDIFGKKSLFQYVNRTVTTFGKKLLAGYFNCPFDKESDIYTRQKAIQELAENVGFRQEYRILGLLYTGQPSDGEEIMQWKETKNHFNNRPRYTAIKWLVPLINLSFIVLAVLGSVSYTVPCLSVFVFMVLSIGLSQYITKVQSSFDKKLHILHTYGQLFELTEQQTFHSEELLAIQGQLKQQHVVASSAIKELAHSMNALDQRNNIFVTAILNGLFFWELYQIMKIESWKDKYVRYLGDWIDSIGKMDALCSLGTYAFNNPSFTYPTLSASPCYRAEGLKHPLMNRDNCVPNDIDMKGAPCFNIITGANMAGKSTYLRTVGINHLLGTMGMPVAAVSMEFYPAHLVTSLRTNDSLTDNESYFFAELKRLKMVIDKLQRGEQLFIILDEILRGTNSVDKQKGSYSFLKQLVLLNATGLIATHDLQLAHLKDSFPEYVNTQCFEADITGDVLTFSYKLRNGVAQNMNACFLMKKMGIDIE
jgi:DNA mismatch repair ATPase MutS